mgnify:CR=1 FL=1
MCGIAGYARLSRESQSPDAATATRMLDVIRHRGPDGEGQWRASDNACWLGHRRLAIIDLATGDQPMTNEDRSVWIVFNGEIYNFGDLRSGLEARTDTRSHQRVSVQVWKAHASERRHSVDQ